MTLQASRRVLVYEVNPFKCTRTIDPQRASPVLRRSTRTFVFSPFLSLRAKPEGNKAGPVWRKELRRAKVVADKILLNPGGSVQRTKRTRQAEGDDLTTLLGDMGRRKTSGTLTRE